MERVRETIDHLVGLGAFRGHPRLRRPGADAAGRRRPPLGAGPDSAHRAGSSCPAARVRRARRCDPRSPSGSARRRPHRELDAIVQAVTGFYADRGYRRPAIESRVVPGRAPEVVTLSLTIDAGPRTLVGDVTVSGDSGAEQAEVISSAAPGARPPLRSRRRWRRASPRSNRSCATTATTRRASTSRRVSPISDRRPDLTVEVERGPRVRVVFAGDPLPENRRDTLVPIRQERSVDLDLLEDASRNIEAFLRQQGYRSADARYVREERSGEMVLTFTVERGPLHRLGVDRGDRQPVGAARRHRAAPGAQAGRAVRRKPRRDRRRAVAELYRVRGFVRVGVKPEIAIGPSARRRRAARRSCAWS